jgi:hypothetical protein
MGRQVQTNCSSAKYQDAAFRRSIRKLVALAFVPVSDGIAGVELVVG